MGVELELVVVVVVVEFVVLLVVEVGLSVGGKHDVSRP